MKASLELEKPQGALDFSHYVAVVLALPIFLTLLAVVFLRAQDEETSLRPIVLATGDYEPYTSRQLGLDGLATAVVDAVFREMGYQPHYEYMPWPLVENGTEINEFNSGIRAAFP